MKKMNERSIALAVGLALSLTLVATAGDEHGEDGVIGITANGQLAVEWGEGTSFDLPPVSGLINGWAIDDPGFLSLEEDEPDEGFFVPDPAAVIALEVISLDPAFKAYTPGFSAALDSPGDTWEIGSPFFDEHPTWHIDSDDPLFDPEQSSWAGTFRVLDSGTTGYAPSDPFTLTFFPVPEPGMAAVLMGMGVLMLNRPQSRRSGR